MVIIQEQNLLQATKKAFLQLLDYPANTNDPLILHEAPAVIEIQDTRHIVPSFELSEQSFVYTDSYAHYIPTIDPMLVSTEEQDYFRLLVSNGELPTIIAHLQHFSTSRRALITCWSSQYLDPDVVGVCVTQWYFRLYNGSLCLHSHARANDAYRLLLLDMQLAVSIQHYIASQIGVKPGQYIHFVDSLHMYRKHRLQISEQAKYIATSPYWQAPIPQKEVR